MFYFVRYAVDLQCTQLVIRFIQVISLNHFIVSTNGILLLSPRLLKGSIDTDPRPL
jgi:hypothetical protein